MQLLKELQNKTNLEEFKEIIMEKNSNLMSGKGEKGEWKTINGAHVYVEDGQSIEEAMNKQFNKGGGSKISDNDRLSKILSERGQSEDADFAKDTDYFGYGSLDELEKAHNAGYKKDEPKKNWEGVKTIQQAKKLDPDIVEKKLASNILFSYGDLNYSDDELANKVNDLKTVKEEYDAEKVKQFIKNNRKTGGKIFTSYRDISESFK